MGIFSHNESRASNQVSDYNRERKAMFVEDIKQQYIRTGQPVSDQVLMKLNSETKTQPKLYHL